VLQSGTFIWETACFFTRVSLLCKIFVHLLSRGLLTHIHSLTLFARKGRAWTHTTHTKTKTHSLLSPSSWQDYKEHCSTLKVSNFTTTHVNIPSFISFAQPNASRGKTRRPVLGFVSVFVHYSWWMEINKWFVLCSINYNLYID